MWLSVHPAGAPENLARFPKGLNIGRYHSSGHTIYMWSIADAWEWFVHIPVLGFILKSAGRTDTKIGFVRVRRRPLKGGAQSVSFDVMRSVWINGRSTHKFVLTLGTQHSDRANAGFWVRANERMMQHGLDAAQRQRVIAEMRRKGAE